MLLVRDFVDAIIAAMLADTAWLKKNTAGVSDLCLVCVAAPFTPSDVLTMGDLTLPPATFLDFQTISLGNDDQNAITSPSGRPGIGLAEPLGGFTFSVGDDSLGPVTIYGVALATQVGGVPQDLLATASIPPVSLNFNGETLQFSSALGFFEQIFQGSTSAIGGTPAIEKSV